MAKKKRHEEHENLERWLVSYADFITLLFAFFTVLYATSQTDAAKMKETMIGIQRAFLSGGGVFPLKGFPFTPFDKPESKGSHVPPSSMDQGNYPKSGQGDSKGERIELDKISAKLVELYRNNTGDPAQANSIDVVPSPEGYKLVFADSVLFSPGSDKIKKKNVPFIYEVGKRLKATGHHVQVEGHTDNAQAEKLDNWQLSLKRSTTVVEFLVGATEFPMDQISIAGFGDTQPVTLNTTELGRARNRRVEIVVMTKGKPITSLPW